MEPGSRALQELWSHSHCVSISRPKCCEGESFHPKGSLHCQLHLMRFSQQVMQRGRMLSEGGFGSISEYSGGGRKRNSWM